MMSASKIPICCILFFVLGSKIRTPEVQAEPDPLWWQQCYDLPIEHNKKTPSPEPEAECTRYRELSCCEANVTGSYLHDDNFHNFDHSPCPQKPRLSPPCQRMHYDQLCFFACSPNYYGVWSETVNRGKPFFGLKHVPLCASQCNRWWEACKEEYTCGRNWLEDFDFDAEGANHCKQGSACQKLSEIYTSAEDFCNIVYDNAYKYTPDHEPCITFSFDASKPNPNLRVAQAAAEKKAWCDCYKNGLGHPGFLYWVLYYMGWFRIWC